MVSSHLLSLNAAKTEKIILTSDRHRGEESTNVKMLGIRVDTRLTWRSHVAHLEQQLSRSVYAVRRIRSIIGQEAALTAYHALFHTRMSYGIVLWGDSPHAEKIFLLQKRAVRAIMGAPFDAHCKPLFIGLRVLTLPATYIFHQLMRAKSDLPTLRTRGEVTLLNTRSRDVIDVPWHRTETSAAKHSHLRLLNRVPTAWRQLPMVAFKQEVKKLLLQNPIYTTDEFLGTV